MPENSTHKCTNAVNNVQLIRNSSHMAKILSVYNRLQAGDYGNGGKRRVSRLTQFIHATLQFAAGQWRRNRRFRRFNEPGPPSSWGPRVVGPQKNFRQDSRKIIKIVATS